MRAPRFGLATLLLVPLAIVGCRGGESRGDLDSLDNTLVEAGGNSATAQDPAIAAALHDQIMVDPTLTQHANANAIRPPTQPYSGALPPEGIAQSTATATDTAATGTSQRLKPAPAPASTACPNCEAARESLTLGALAARQKDSRTRNCAGAMRYSASWATRLPAGLMLYPNAHIVEAAGANTATCALRAVSFSAAAPLKTVIDYYYTRLTGAGFTAEHQSDGTQHTLGGTRDRDGGAYVLFLTARRDGGTDVDLVANNGT